jgi:hypothetical protein
MDGVQLADIETQRNLVEDGRRHTRRELGHSRLLVPQQTELENVGVVGKPPGLTR